MERNKVIIQLMQKIPNLRDSRIFYIEGKVDTYLELDEKEQINEEFRNKVTTKIN